tara:strand:- start:46 stop:570 length:525 start_codon:yes stop_codon:yes gene_type:complete
MNEHIIKITRHPPITECFNLEKQCLRKLNNNFTCICNNKREHFPRLQKCDKYNHAFVLSNCGLSIDKYTQMVKTGQLKPYKLKNYNKQINCILYNLNKCKIQHLDMHCSGKNLCINKKGVLSLIDFDYASINGLYTRRLKNKVRKCNRINYNLIFKKQCIHIISKLIKNKRVII